MNPRICNIQVILPIFHQIESFFRCKLYQILAIETCIFAKKVCFTRGKLNENLFLFALVLYERHVKCNNKVVQHTLQIAM